MNPPTPKYKSKDFKVALANLKAIFDARALGTVLSDGLERRSAEQICARMKPRTGASPAGASAPVRGLRVKDMKRAQLVEQITEVFFSDDEVAFQTMKELDRVCQKERHIVSSIPEAQAAERIDSYRAMALARERARMIWALARDDREAVRELANKVIARVMEEVAQLETAKAVLDGRTEVPPESVELARKLQQQAGQLTQAAERVSSLESKVSKFEEERARLLAQMGSKERVIRQESQARETLDLQIDELRTQLAELESRDEKARIAIENEAEARATADELQQKVRRLSKLAGASKSLTTLQSELERAKKEAEDFVRRLAHSESERQRADEAHVKEQAKLRIELDELREELHTARKRIVELERKVPADFEQGEGPPEGSVAILLDQANLAATASMAFRRKVNFAALLDQLTVGRIRRRAIAFVVDNGGAQFDAFCETLRRSGWELRIKKPKLFQDGTSKADWDMGIAVEAVELRGVVSTVTLVSGDGDFAPLLKLLKRWGMRVEVAAFPDGMASDLQNVADAVKMLGTESLE